jgi:hypothetical protein
LKVEVIRMTAKELVGMLFEERVPPVGWGRWVWHGRDGYGVSSLVPENTPPPVGDGEEVLFWWGWGPFARPAGEEALAEEGVKKVITWHVLAILITQLRIFPRWHWKEENYKVVDELVLALRELGQESGLVWE